MTAIYRPPRQHDIWDYILGAAIVACVFLIIASVRGWG